MSELEDDLFFLAQNLAMAVSPMEVGRRASQLVDHDSLHNRRRPPLDDEWRKESDKLVALYWKMVRDPDSFFHDESRADRQQEGDG